MNEENRLKAPMYHSLNADKLVFYNRLDANNFAPGDHVMIEGVVFTVSESNNALGTLKFHKLADVAHEVATKSLDQRTRATLQPTVTKIKLEVRKPLRFELREAIEKRDYWTKRVEEERAKP